jgi:pimeloyl-ACP methyl ester carboxylesterase
VFVVDSGEGERTPLFILHGFPTSSWDFAPAIDALAKGRRVVTFDFLGFGFSEKPPGLAYSLMEQADVAIAAARASKLHRVHLWAHDMGTSVATELLARRERGLLPFEIQSLVLMNGSVHIDMASLTLGQRLLKSPLGNFFARLNNARSFKTQMRRVFAKPPGDNELDAMWELLSREKGTRLLPKIIRYTTERTLFAHRWIGALERLDVPTLVAWGARDPVAVIAIAEKLAGEIPGAELVRWADLGHYPQVEDFQRVVETLGAFLQRTEQAYGVSCAWPSTR